MFQAIFSTFTLVFLAELGDKTQLAVLAMASRSSTPWGVFIGASAALVLSSLLAVGLGGLLARFLPETSMRIIHYVAGGLFILMGTWTIWKA